MRRTRVAQGSHTQVSIEAKEDALVPVRNTGNVPQIIGAITLAPGELQWLSPTVARALCIYPGIVVEWPKARDCNALQLRIHLGLGDNIFALAAAYAYHIERPGVRIWLDTAEVHREWMSWVPFVRFGIAPVAAEFVDLNGVGGQSDLDRTTLIASILGTECYDMRFPIDIPDMPLQAEKPYWVFAPFSKSRGIRSFPQRVVEAVLSGCAASANIALVDEAPYATDSRAGLTNLSGRTTLAQLWSLVQHSEGVISVDTGIGWLAAALGKPGLMFFGHVAPSKLAMTAKTVWAVEPSVPCYPCGVAGCPRPECMNYDPAVVTYKVLEWMEIVRSQSVGPRRERGVRQKGRGRRRPL